MRNRGRKRRLVRNALAELAGWLLAIAIGIAIFAYRYRTPPPPGEPRFDPAGWLLFLILAAGGIFFLRHRRRVRREEARWENDDPA